MKLSTVVAIVAMTSGVALGRPSHRHLHKHLGRHAESEPDMAVAYVFEYQGHDISSQEVQEGIANGTLVVANGAVVPKASVSAQSITAQSVTTPAATARPVSAFVSGTSSDDAVLSSSSVAPSSSSPSAAVSAQAASSPSVDAPSGSASASSSTTGGQGLDTYFPDGEIDCSEFPSAYGAVSLDYLNLGGWSGIQCPNSVAVSGFGSIETKKSGSCDEGDYCSYACPAGYEKTQWPTTQGSTGQSIGGLLCKSGKLYLTNPELSKNLCSKGASEVSVTVKNTMSEGASICRTDYPGTEGETIPLQADPGTTSDLTCPNAADYYDWQGKSTSAQYYVNPKGVSSQEGCQWGSADNNWGNFAPLNLGVGYSNGAAWLSIFPNTPTTNAELDFSIEIVGDGLSGRCKYENGQYHSGENYDQTSATGCTVSSPMDWTTPGVY